MKRIRAVAWGLGAMGQGIADLMLQRGVEVVAAISHQVGEDLGTVLHKGDLGITVRGPDDPPDDIGADICVIATDSRTAEVAPQILWAVSRSMNVITCAEEMFVPHVREPSLSRELHERALRHDVSVLGTGINPGFVMDTLVVALSAPCREIRSISVRRSNNLAPYGATVMSAFGIGLTPEEFRSGLARGDLSGHVGFAESMHFISDAIGLGVDEVVESREAIVGEHDVTTKWGERVPAGRVTGIFQVAVGLRRGKPVLRLEHPQRLHPELSGVATGDFIAIDGDPPISVSIEPEIEGGVGTVGMVTNMIPHVIAAPAGIVTMADLPLPRFDGTRQGSAPQGG